MSKAGTIKELWRYPVKSMAGESLQRACVESLGVVGDRLWAVRDETTGLITNGKKIPRLLLCRARYLEEPTDSGSPPPVLIRLPNGTELRSDRDVGQGLSDFLERKVCLVPRQLPDLYFDVSPLHILSTGSLAALRSVAAESQFPALRFRPNILVDLGSDTSAAEMRWCGKQACAGAVRVYIDIPTERCSMIMRAQEGIPEDPDVLRIVAKRENLVGVYGTVAATGQLQVGQDFVVADIQGES